jgi:hypothetical protein
MGDYVYSFSSGGATVHRTADLQLMVELELPGNEPYASYAEVAPSEATESEEAAEAEAEEEEEEEDASFRSQPDPID